MFLVGSRAPKKIEKIRGFLFPLMNFQNWFIVFIIFVDYFNEFNESTNKIFVDFTKFQRIFNENFNESTKILKKSSNSLKFCSKLVDALKIAIDFSWFFESLVDLLESSLKIR